MNRAERDREIATLKARVAEVEMERDAERARADELATWKAAAIQDLFDVSARADLLAGEVGQLREALNTLIGALDRDASGMSKALGDIQREVRGRTWLLESRGPYEWDDDRYRDEAGAAMQAVLAIADKALSASGSLFDGAYRDARKVALSGVGGPDVGALVEAARKVDNESGDLSEGERLLIRRPLLIALRAALDAFTAAPKGTPQ